MRWNMLAINLSEVVGVDQVFVELVPLSIETKGENKLKVVLACQSQVEDGMYLTQIPFFPGKKAVYDMDKIEPTAETMGELYPELYKCIGL